MIGLAYEFRATAYLYNNIWQIKTKYLDGCAEAFRILFYHQYIDYYFMHQYWNTFQKASAQYFKYLVFICQYLIANLSIIKGTFSGNFPQLRTL